MDVDALARQLISHVRRSAEKLGMELDADHVLDVIVDTAMAWLSSEEMARSVIVRSRTLLEVE